MTMNTRVHVAQPTNPEALFLHVLGILESDPRFVPSWTLPEGEPFRASPGPLRFGKATYTHVRKGEVSRKADGTIFRHATTGEPFVEDENEYRSTLGQGLAAIWEVQYAGDGPLTWPHRDDEPCDGADCCPDYGNTVEPPRQFCIGASFDTAYGYRMPNGGGCADLHAFLLREIGLYLADVGVTEWVWHHEEAGTWHGSDEIDRRGNAALAAAYFGRAIDGSASRG